MPTSAHIDEYLVVLNNIDAVETKPLLKKYLGGTRPKPREATLCSLALIDFRVRRACALLDDGLVGRVEPGIRSSQVAGVKPRERKRHTLRRLIALRSARLLDHRKSGLAWLRTGVVTLTLKRGVVIDVRGLYTRVERLGERVTIANPVKRRGPDQRRALHLRRLGRSTAVVTEAKRRRIASLM